MLDPWSLRILVEVGRQGSFSAAADALVLTQPAVSRQIAGLEKQLGVALFRRTPRGVSPTNGGTVAIELAGSVLARLDAMEGTIKSFAGLDGGDLRLAAFASANTHFVPAAIQRFHAAHPGVTITLLHVDPFDTLEAVSTGGVDLALLTAWQLYADASSARTDPLAPLAVDAIAAVELVPLLDEELHIALPDQHPLVRRPTIRLGDLRDETWIEGAPPDCLGPLHQITEAIGGPPRIGFTCHDWNGKQALVAGGAGIMLVPTLARAAIRPDIQLRPTTPPLPTRRLYAAVPRPPFRTQPAGAFLDLLTTMVPTPARRRKAKRSPVIVGT